jgi:hypothetical protein
MAWSSSIRLTCTFASMGFIACASGPQGFFESVDASAPPTANSTESFSCSAGPSCTEDPWSKSEEAACITSASDSSCGEAFKSLMACEVANAVCESNGTANGPATLAACGNLVSTYASCTLAHPHSSGGMDDSGAPEAGPTKAVACDPTSAGCVACGTKSCASPEECCGTSESQSCGSAASCSGKPLSATCDGPEDCAGAQCCVSLDAYSNATGASATCGAACPLLNASGGPPEGEGLIIQSVACHSSADCVNIYDSDYVPYENCCQAEGFDLRTCMSDTFASVLSMNGGSCD